MKNIKVQRSILALAFALALAGVQAKAGEPFNPAATLVTATPASGAGLSAVIGSGAPATWEVAAITAEFFAPASKLAARAGGSGYPKGAHSRAAAKPAVTARIARGDARSIEARP